MALSRHASGALAFSANSQQLIVGTVDGKIVVLDLNTFEVLRSFTVESNGSTACALSRFILSADGVWLAALDTKHRLRVYNLDSMQHHATLPVLDGIPTSFAFDAGCGSLVVGLSSATSKKQLFVYNVEGGARADDTSATAAAARAEQFRSVDVPGSITGLAFDPDDPYAVLCTGVNFLARATVRLDGAPASTAEAEALHGTEAAGVSVVTRLDPLLHAAVTGPSTLLTIERRWVDVVEQLPEPIVRPKYGT
jgi:U3 small nucleolar RNA-associated protein 4